MRIILKGTEKKLAKPSRAHLSLPDWDNSYLEWVDLSGLKIPRMQDADVFHYKATGTVFQNTDWTMFRFPIDLTGSRWPLDVSSYNHDGIVGVLERAPNTDHPAVRLVHDHVAADYHHSWQDSMWRLNHELGMTMEDIWDVFRVAFEGYSSLLGRLKWHCGNISIKEVPPDIQTKKLELQIGGELREIDVRGWAQFLGRDRFQANQVIHAAVLNDKGIESGRYHVTQLVPFLVMYAATESVPQGNQSWWQDRWRA